MRILNYILNARNAVRKAIGLAPIPLHDKLPEPPTELQKRMKPFANAPQWFRLLMLYRLTKRQYRKRRHGMSAKAAYPGRVSGATYAKRLGRPSGPNSYDYFKAEQAALRAAKRVAS